MNDPKTYKQPIEFPKWQEVLKTKLDALHKNETRNPAALPPDK